MAHRAERPDTAHGYGLQRTLSALPSDAIAAR
ncbi:hypothetical protein SHXM_03574 [Streptomyces hygroscopicus]|nr:hypothetical protein SHXM_03574 [Streptomyces hygroscopicus]